MRTKDRLVEDLLAANAPEWMVANATSGVYDDFETLLVAPITQLVFDCQQCGLYEIGMRAKEGGYDASPKEMKAWHERERMWNQGVMSSTRGGAT